MPKGPRGEKRPADVIGAAVKVMRIATGEEMEELDAPAPRRHWAATIETGVDYAVAVTSAPGSGPTCSATRCGSWTAHRRGSW